MADKETLRQLFSASARFMMKVQDRKEADPFYNGLFSYWSDLEDAERLKALTKTAKEQSRHYEAIFNHLRGASKEPPSVPQACAELVIQSADLIAQVSMRFTDMGKLASYLPEKVRCSTDYEAAFNEYNAPNLAKLCAPTAP